MKKILSIIKASEQKEFRPLPYPVYFWTTAIMALAGIADSVYLAISHYRNYTDLTYQSFCAISKAINCDTISQSSYSIFIGIPVPIWGVIGYSAFFILVLYARRIDQQTRHIWSLAFVIAGGFSLYSLVLALISAYLIHTYCIMCIVSYLINFFLFYYAWLIRRRFEKTGLLPGLIRGADYLAQKKITVIPLCAALISVLVLLWVALPEYWRMRLPEISTEIPNGVTADGHPWIGADAPAFTIIEFADYRCFQCKKLHFFLRRLMAEKPDKIKLIHRHFPMDHQFNPIVIEPMHIGSGFLSLIAISAMTEGKFWPMNDLLFERMHTYALDVAELAQIVGIDPNKLAYAIGHPQVRSILDRDMRDGVALGIMGTPSFIINGQVFAGHIPPQILTEMIK